MEYLKRTTKMVGFETSIPFAEAIKEKAKEDRRSMAGYMKYVLSKDINYRGEV